MHCLRLLALTLPLALPFSLTATAQADGGLMAGGKISTLGAGGELGLALSDHLTLRASATAFSYDFSETLDDIDSDLELDLGAIGAQLDVHPFANGFFLTGGAFSNLNEITTRAMPSNPVEIGDTVYQPAEIGVIEGVGTFDETVGYLGLGHVWGHQDGWQFAAEAGAYFQGAPTITYEATGLLANDPGFLADLEAEAASAQSDLENFDTYPVVSLALRRRF